ncbi:MAG: hypothetical protein NVSMB64_28020 [Candidatus Velthaea sp.]
MLVRRIATWACILSVQRQLRAMTSGLMHEKPCAFVITGLELFCHLSVLARDVLMKFGGV